MAKKYESDIDPDEFIRSFREEPSLGSAIKKSEPEPEAEEPVKAVASAEEKPPRQRVRNNTVSKDDEEEFSERFIRDMTHMRPKNKYLMVEISPEFIRKIKRIISFEEGSTCSVKAYVNNVLADHFREYCEIIKKRL